MSRRLADSAGREVTVSDAAAEALLASGWREIKPAPKAKRTTKDED